MFSEFIYPKSLVSFVGVSRKKEEQLQQRLVLINFNPYKNINILYPKSIMIIIWPAVSKMIIKRHFSSLVFPLEISDCC